MIPGVDAINWDAAENYTAGAAPNGGGAENIFGIDVPNRNDDENIFVGAALNSAAAENIFGVGVPNPNIEENMLDVGENNFAVAALNSAAAENIFGVGALSLNIPVNFDGIMLQTISNVIQWGHSAQKLLCCRVTYVFPNNQGETKCVKCS